MPVLVSFRPGAPSRLDVGHLRDAEVDDLHEVLTAVALRQEDVLGLHVAVNDALAVRGPESAWQHCIDDVGGARDRDRRLRAAARSRGPRPRGAPSRSTPFAARRLAEVGDVDDVGVADPARALRLLLEALDDLLPVREVVAQDLERDPLLDRDVHRLRRRGPSRPRRSGA